MRTFASVALWVYLDSSYCLIQNCALVLATGWVPMAESSCTWTRAGWHKVKTPQRLSRMSVVAAVALQDRRLRKSRIFVIYVIYRKRIEITIDTLTLRSGFGNWLLWAGSQPNHSREHADYSQGGGFPRP